MCISEELVKPSESHVRQSLMRALTHTGGFKRFQEALLSTDSQQNWRQPES
jgi:hypothetical protein